jgi:predicted lipoprotein with Yx(FWY)xxD motif
MKFRHAPLLTVAVVVLAAIGLAACGGSDDSNSDTNSGSAGATPVSNGGETVATKSISGTGNVLVDSSGMALYTNDQDTSSKVACTGECVTEWVPLAAPAGGQPTSSDSAVQGKLGTIKRTDGSSQVTLDGLPLYTFVDDSPGQVTGNGDMDSFGGTDFLWTVASASGKAAPSSATTTSGSSDDSSGGGYGGGY